MKLCYRLDVGADFWRFTGTDETFARLKEIRAQVIDVNVHFNIGRNQCILNVSSRKIFGHEMRNTVTLLDTLSVDKKVCFGNI